jgi:hypothetical protein
MPAPPEEQTRSFRSRQLKRTHKACKLSEESIRDKRTYSVCVQRPQLRRALLLLVWAGVGAASAKVNTKKEISAAPPLTAMQ